MLEGAIRPTIYKGPAVEFVVRNPKESNEIALEKILAEIKSKDSNVKIGKIANEPGIGNLVEEWKKVIGKDSKYKLTDINYIVY
jgi:hypothetical protein